MKKNQGTDFLRRYTSLPQLLQILQTESLTLLDPRYWDDKNDGALIEKYCKKKKLKKVLALCFAESSETYHHWKIYAEGVAGGLHRVRQSSFIAGRPRAEKRSASWFG